MSLGNLSLLMGHNYACPLFWIQILSLSSNVVRKLAPLHWRETLCLSSTIQTSIEM